MSLPLVEGVDACVDFSIIIPTYRRRDELSACLQALSQMEYSSNQFEVIVVDDGGDAPLDAVIAPFHDRMQVKLLRQAHAGPAAARNTGSEHASGRFLAFTDDDCIPVPAWLWALAARFRRTPDRLIGGRVFNTLWENPYSTASHLIVDLVYAHYNTDPGRARFFATNNLAVPAERFRVLGGFDATFATSEDREFCDRWLQHGYLMTHAPEAVVYHAHALTLAGFCHQHFRYGRGAFRFHQARARRGSGRLKQEFSFYARIPRLLRGAFHSLTYQQTLSLALLLFVWQGANAVGYFWQGLSQTLPLPSYRRRGDAERSGLASPGKTDFQKDL